MTTVPENSVPEGGEPLHAPESPAIAVTPHAAHPAGDSPAEGGVVANESPTAEMVEVAEEEVEDEPEPDLPFALPLEFIDESIDEANLKYEWYILKVQVNREDSIRDALMRRLKMEGLDRFVKEVVVPTEDVAEFTKTGKRKVVKKKIYPGYILVNMSVNDDTWFVVRETPGIGDFTGSSGKPSAMDPKDVERILRASKPLDDESAVVKIGIPFKPGERVRVKEGNFQNLEGEVGAVDEAHGRITVMLTIFGRQTPVDMEHWNIEKL